MQKFRFITSGESHGKCLNAIIEGLPAGFDIDEEFINNELKRRQLGYGRGGRMSIETDTVEIKSGVRFGKTTGAPICLEIMNKDFENWQIPMSVSEVNFYDKEVLKQIAEKSITKPRPGHADFAGAIKYNLEDLRDVLERSSARKTAMNVAIGAVAKQILKEFSIVGFSHVIQIGEVKAKNLSANYTIVKELAEKSSLRCADEPAEIKMKTLIDKAKASGDTLGGKFEIVFANLPVGLGSYVHWDRKLDGKIAQAVMSIGGVKSVEIGAGVDSSKLLGSQMHDEIFVDAGNYYRMTNRAGGIEGGMTNGEYLIVKGSMKAIPTMRKPLSTIDFLDNSQTQAHFERSDTTAVPACGVVAEAMIACVLVDEFLIKFGGDSLSEIRKNFEK